MPKPSSDACRRSHRWTSSPCWFRSRDARARLGRRAKRQIKEIAIFLGIPENRWPEVETKLELASKIEDPWEMLGIDRDATRADIKKAYRTKLAGLHPDKVARMDPEIQDLARTRTVELREAYESVLDQG